MVSTDKSDLSIIAHCMDDKAKRAVASRYRIDISELYERREWAKKLGVTTEMLEAAVKKVGPNIRAVKKALGKL